uniref:LCP family protein n=1 Tax=Rossellomorea aquimaris TaxID=189382 RepID=UPI0007D084B2
MYSRSNYRARKRLRKKRIFRVILFLFLIITIGGATFFGINFFTNTQSATNKIYQELDPDKFGEKMNDVEVTKDPFTILMTGVENQEGGLGRSDVLLLLTVNPKTEEIKMLSIPRDTLTYVEEAGYETKITHAYSYGGIEPTIEAVNELIDVPIDYYVTTNFKGFEDIIDTLGGVTVDVPFTFKAQLTDSLRWKTYYEGKMDLNGNEALAYVRMRKQDPRGDLGRNERQQQVIRAIMEEGTSISKLPKINNVIEDVGNNVKTNIPPSKFLSFVKLYTKMKDTKIERLSIDGVNDYIDGASYYLASEESLDELTDILNSTLEKNTSSNE